jgi:hypothetical protein
MIAAGNDLARGPGRKGAGLLVTRLLSLNRSSELLAMGAFYCGASSFTPPQTHPWPGPVFGSSSSGTGCGAHAGRPCCLRCGALVVGNHQRPHPTLQVPLRDTIKLLQHR